MIVDNLKLPNIVSSSFFRYHSQVFFCHSFLLYDASVQLSRSPSISELYNRDKVICFGRLFLRALICFYMKGGENLSGLERGHMKL